MIEKILALFCKKIICISEAEKKSALEKKICKQDKLKVIFNGIDIKDYEEKSYEKITRTDIGIPQNAFVIGMVGRITTQKAPDIFIRMAKKIKDYIPETYFIIVGDGEQKEEIIEYANKHNLKNSLLITGWIENPISYIKIFDIAMLLSRWEGFGLVLLEYMIAGKPIIATNVDAIPNIILDRVNGLLVDEDNINQIFEKVMELKKDLKLKEEIIDNGRKLVYKQFNISRVAKQHEELFGILCNNQFMKDREIQ